MSFKIFNGSNYKIKYFEYLTIMFSLINSIDFVTFVEFLLVSVNNLGLFFLALCKHYFFALLF